MQKTDKEGWMGWGKKSWMGWEKKAGWVGRKKKPETQ